MVERADKTAISRKVTRFEGELSSFNSFFEFSEGDREAVIRALRIAASFLPTQEQYDSARVQDGMEMDEIQGEYKIIADAYAISIDPTYDPNQANNNPNTIQNRERFYSLVHNRTAEQVYIAAQDLARFVPPHAYHED